MGAIVGGIIGVYILSICCNFIIRKITNSDTIAQRVIAIVIAVFIAISVWTMTQGELFEGLLSYGIGGIFTYFVFAKRVNKIGN